MYYISNNVHLHDRDASNMNAEARLESHRDLVYKTTLIQSSLVRNVVESFNAVQGNSRHARNERRRILSQIVMDFSYKLCCQLELKIPDAGSCVRTNFTHNTHTCTNSLTHSLTHSTLLRYKDRTLSRRAFYEARSHASAFGPGNPPFHVPHVQRVKISTEKITRAFSFIMDDERVQKLACGTSDLVLSTGETLTVPAVARKFLRTHVWANFAREHTGSDGVYNGGISCTDFFEIIGSATTKEEKFYAALDQVRSACVLCMSVSL